VDAVHLEPEMGFQYVSSSRKYLAGYVPSEHCGNREWVKPFEPRHIVFNATKAGLGEIVDLTDPGDSGTVGRNRSGE